MPPAFGQWTMNWLLTGIDCKAGGDSLPLKPHPLQKGPSLVRGTCPWNMLMSCLVTGKKPTILNLPIGSRSATARTVAIAPKSLPVAYCFISAAAR